MKYNLILIEFYSFFCLSFSSAFHSFLDKLISLGLPSAFKPVQQSGFKTCGKIPKERINKRKHILDANVDMCVPPCRGD